MLIFAIVKAQLPKNELARLENLRRYNILDSDREQEYDDLTFIASQICGAPVSMISLIDKDRQWYKSTLGVDPDLRETGRDIAFCAHSILDPEHPTVVKDMRSDDRFADNPFVVGDPRAVFYAGVPLLTREGYALGTICVLDLQPRELTEDQLDALRRLSRQVVKLLELRQALQQTEAKHNQLEWSHNNLKEFCQLVAHDLKAPLRSIQQYTELLREDHQDCLNEDGLKMLGTLGALSADAREMVQGVLRYSVALNGLDDNIGRVDLHAVIDTLSKRLQPSAGSRIEFVGEVSHLQTSELAIEHILQNLIGNALKFSDKTDTLVRVSCTKAGSKYEIGVVDNGPGIAEEELRKVFSMFYTTAPAKGGEGHGVGLTIVKRMAEMLGGTVSLSSTVGTGSVFTVTLEA